MKKFSSLLIALILSLCSLSAALAEDDLARVKSSGVLNMGTSSDYVPFVYMEGTTLDGIDVALMNEIGRRMGVQVRPVDIAFDGLADALNIGQVDIIGGAITITDSRKEIVDFTRAYYQAKGIVVSRSGNVINESNVSTARVGVQLGTNFDQWVQTNLLMGGHVTTDRVYRYNKEKEMMSALLSGKIDLALIDEDVYITLYKNTGQYQIVDGNIAQEKYGFAGIKGSTLIPEVNRILKEMISDGTAQKIANRYFSMDFSEKLDEGPSITRPEQAISEAYELIRKETPTVEIVNPVEPAPQIQPQGPIAQNAPNCFNGMQYVSDVSIPDATVLGYDQPETKSWVILNTGTCSWDSTYSFNYVKGDLFGVSSVQIDKIVAPGQTYTMNVPFTTPSYAGSFVSYWQMRNTAGQNFGQTIWYNFITSGSGGSGSAPQGSLSGSPKIYTFKPNFYKTSDGTCPTITYEVVNATKVEFFVNNQFQTSTTNRKGKIQVCFPKAKGTYTYAIRAVGDGSISDAFQFINEYDYSKENQKNNKKKK